MQKLLISLLAATAASAGTVTFHKDVLPILQNRCQGCHRPGEVAPMSFLTYKDVRPWAKAMREAVLIRKMPPWFADPSHGKFVNDPSLSKPEIDTLVAWSDQGAPEGDPKQAPPPVPFVAGWNIGQPDMVFELPMEFSIPASGTIDYQHFVIPTGFKEDKWVQFAEVRPGARSVVHHVIAYIREPGSKWLREAKPGVPVPLRDAEALPAGIVAGFAPGLPPTVLAENQGILVKAGSDLVVQMHYTTNGKAAKDRTRIGLIFNRRAPSERMTNVAPHNRKFTIPAGADNYRVDSSVTLQSPSTLLAMMPHMHFRGKSFEYRVIYPGGKSEVLLRIPNYDFNWQLFYALEKPLALPAGARIECTAYYDNSANNKYNPDPKVAVRWGDQTWEEMMIGWMYVTLDAKGAPSGLVKEKEAVPASGL
ncbi:MAG: thiol-disulfide isomerase [Acidobacteria bacterium]|nr:thiol-disulfide isomerase [Acidobacteriota bacterium]